MPETRPTVNIPAAVVRHAYPSAPPISVEAILPGDLVAMSDGYHLIVLVEPDPDRPRSGLLVWSDGDARPMGYDRSSVAHVWRPLRPHANPEPGTTGSTAWTTAPTTRP